MSQKVSRIDAEAERIRAGRDLSPFDMEAVQTVAGLTIRVRDAREQVERDGAIIDDGHGGVMEHPVIMVEKRASQELRGWVKDRPDLFGPQKEKKAAPRQRFEPRVV